MKKIIVISIIILVAGLTFCLGYNLANKQKSIMETEVPVKLEQPEFFQYKIPTDSLVLAACKYYGLSNDSIVLSQAKLETGNYNSYQCKVNNNLFGLYNSAKGEYYKFNYWWESVEAYKNWIQYRHKEGENYYAFLSRIGYAEDPNYNQKLEWIRQMI